MIRPVEGMTIRRPPETACRQDPTSHAGRTHGAGATNTAACMEHLWSRAGANGREAARIDASLGGLGQARIVAVGCRQLRAQGYGKEGVDGSSPSEGLQLSPA